MTREEALKKIKDEIRMYDEESLKSVEWKECYEALNDTVSRGVLEQVMWERDIAIEQLRKLGYELGQKIEPCDDAISREDTLKAIIENLGIRSKEYLLEAEKAVYKTVENMPPVTPQQKYGKWIYDKMRAEIGSMDFDFGDFYDHTSTIREMVLAVIDKYKAESEEV